MKHLIRRLFPLALALVMLFPLMPIQAAEPIHNISVGILFGSDAVASANLQNSDGYGAGYRFGYYDGDLNFIELGRTGEDVTKVTVLRGIAMYQSGTSYSKEDNGGNVIGCYHIALNESFETFEAARARADEFGEGFVARINGAYSVRIGAYLTKDIALAKQAELGVDSTITDTSVYGLNVVETGSSQIIFQYDGGAGYALGIYPDVTDCDEIATWCKGYRYAGAFRYERVSGGDITVSSVVDLDTYVKGVIPYEMANDWPLEALKAQAICARSYGYRRIISSSHTSDHFDICNTTHCQVYHGLGSNSTSYQANDLTNQAVDETAGELLMYGDTMADTFFSSSHGGASENIENVWGTSLSKYPYLCGVIDPYEPLIADKNFRSSWTKTYTKSELTSILQANGYGGGTSVQGVETVFSTLGNVYQLIFHFANGKTQTFAASSLMRSSILGLYSIHYTINGEMPEQETDASAFSFTVNDGDILEGTPYAVSNTNTTQKLDIDSSVYVLSGEGILEAIDFSSLNEADQNEPVDFSGSVYTEADTLVFSGGGWGHQLGMSQWGARAMAELCDMTYDEIVTFYFPGTHLEILG